LFGVSISQDISREIHCKRKLNARAKLSANCDRCLSVMHCKHASRVRGGHQKTQNSALVTSRHGSRAGWHSLDIKRQV